MYLFYLFLLGFVLWTVEDRELVFMYEMYGQMYGSTQKVISRRSLHILMGLTIIYITHNSLLSYIGIGYKNTMFTIVESREFKFSLDQEDFSDS